MNQIEFREAVKERTSIRNNDRAGEIIAAVLGTLGTRINADEAQHLAAQLPEPYKTYAGSAGSMETFDIDEFFARIAGELRVSRGVAIRYARVVMDVLDEAISPGQMSDVRAQLPETFNVLVESETA